ncbi:MAG: GNAT family N-acetyltransferase [Candidatus Caldatribacteriota bacterium]|nr:GNAT family N-acetyltransferase [Candidatus Caldatribacteriota bacterium]
MKKFEDKENNLKIRKASYDDIPLILKFIKELSIYEKMSKEVVATEDILRETLFGDKPYARVLIAEIDKEPVGYALYFYNFSTFVGRPGLYIEDVFVSEKYRGQGVGTALFKYCARIAKKDKCVRMEWSVLKWNPAREFYEHMGAKSMDEWVVYRLTAGTGDGSLYQFIKSDKKIN